MRTRAIVLLFGIAAAALADASAQTAGADLTFDDSRSVYKRRVRPPEPPDKADWEARVTQLLREEPGDVVITAVGDIILNEQISTLKDPARQQLFRIMQEADLAYGNLEFSLNRHPEAQRVFYNFRADPEFAWELAALGINLVSMANNHALDFGPEGLKDCLTALDRADITHAGAGMTPAAARAPGVTGVQSRKTRFALLSYMRYWTQRYRCADPQGACLATIDPAVVLVAQGGGAVEAVEGPQEDDVKAMEDDIVLAGRREDVVIVSLHNHDRSHHRAHGIQDTTPPNDEIMYRRAIDAGAAFVLGSGPHVLRGVEIYKGRPILYSLADFVYQYRTPGRIPVDLIHQRDGEIERPANVSVFDRRDPPQVMEGILARFTLNGGTLRRLELIPISIDDEGPLYGVPRLARDARAKEIIANLQRLSAPYGTRLADRGWYAEVVF
jgi:poly-gamma-glutamate synthesis protein (capsule biosynthesis protein)